MTNTLYSIVAISFGSTSVIGLILFLIGSLRKDPAPKQPNPYHLWGLSLFLLGLVALLLIIVCKLTLPTLTKGA